ncbi:MAG: MFS transporter [Chloroflexi bacterium]|nr:MAG: MFS transporter [Chloroflexota bacterium]MBL1195382.1 MFS transporter [Chloroflexota bacterium]NOH12665.1 MFS transporter [Chloroflexota bacterium]
MARQFSVEDGRKWRGSFFTIWTGQAISLLGSQLVQFALIWYLTVTTNSATVLATASLVGLLPQVIFGPLAGSLVDRWNRRVIMIVADTVIAVATVAIAVLFAFDLIQVWHIYVLMFVRSTAGGFHVSSMTASTSLMVPEEHLTRIQGINQTLNGGLSIIGAPLGALLLELLPMQGILAIDVITAVLAIVPLFFINVPQPDRAIQDGEGKSSVWNDFVIGVRYALAWRGLGILMIVVALINFLLTPAFALLPLLVKDYFGGGAIQLGTLEAFMGSGIIIGGITLGVWGGFNRRMTTSILGIIGIGVGVLILSLAPANAFWLALLAAIVFGFMQPMANGPLFAIIQARVAPDMQGRMFSLIGSLATAMAPIGLIFAGPIADFFGIRTWFFVGGAACVAVGIFCRLVPSVYGIEENGQSASIEAQPEAA